MKTICDFCKTEYNLDKFPNSPIKCAVCGHVWMPRRPFQQNTWLKFFAALCALVAACVFSFVVIMRFQNDKNNNKPIIASIDEHSVRVIVDENGDNRIFVSGNIRNTTDDIYGLPNLIILSYDANDNVLSRQAFIPPSTFIEPKTTVTFNHVLSVNPANVKRVAIELKESK